MIEVITKLYKKAQTLVIRLLVHHKPLQSMRKPTLVRKLSTIVIYCSFIFRGGDSEAIEQIM